ncbi:MAG: SHD1 domain-containing protein [Planctomycetota bacterium]
MGIAMTVAVFGVVVGGCSPASESGATPTGPSSAAPVPEAYPGVISPVDVDPKAAPATAGDHGFLAREPAEKKVAFLVAKYGVDAVVAVKVEGYPPDQGALIQERIRTAALSSGSFVTASGDRTVGYLAPVTDLEGFAGRLQIGETTVDSQKRVVLVKADPAKLTGEAASGQAEPRTWVDSTGQFEVEATLIDVTDGQVTLKGTDGSTMSIGLERLSETDQEFVRTATAKRGDPGIPSRAARPGLRQTLRPE